MARDVDMTTDRPAHETEHEIEVTPEMIEAGLKVYYEADTRFETASDIVRDIIRAAASLMV